jgi:antibiotic biosynthesis monooxygenase (ABM) superfamily enzyme
MMNELLHTCGVRMIQLTIDAVIRVWKLVLELALIMALYYFVLGFGHMLGGLRDFWTIDELFVIQHLVTTAGIVVIYELLYPDTY